MSDTWIIEGASAYMEQSGPYRDHTIRVERDVVIVTTVGATSEENVAAELEIPIDVVRAVLHAVGGLRPISQKETDLREQLTRALRRRDASPRRVWGDANEAEAEVERLTRELEAVQR